MSVSKVTPIGRASFPNLNKPDQYNKYSMAILLPKSDPKVMEFAKWMKGAVTKEAIDTHGEAHLNAAMAEFTNWKDGDNVDAFKTYRNEYAGHFVLNMGRKTEYGRPCIVNRNKQPIDPTEIYAGCNILVFIDVFGYKYGSKRSVSIGFQHVMKTGENTPFASTGVDVDDAFGSLDIPDENDLAPTGPSGKSAPAASVSPANPFGNV